MTNKEIAEKWKIDQINKIFGRNKGACMTYDFMNNTSMMIKEVQKLFEEISRSSDDLSKVELPQIVIHPKCDGCYKQLRDYPNLFEVPSKRLCSECTNSLDV